MQPITVSTVVNADIDKVWRYWTEPAHIIQWAFAADDWEAPHAENDVREGGTFLTRMAAKDGSAGFDFTGTYTNVIPNELIEYTMSDGRNVSVVFEQTDEGIKIVETFDPETENDIEMQRGGWQAILENFKQHVENS